jgi:hypothetical protein
MNLIQRYVASVPDELRNFGGNPPSAKSTEPPWDDAKFVESGTERRLYPASS